MTDLMTLAVLGVAGILAGAVNAVAGGGTFITFPVLIWAGLPPLVANTTNMVALVPANGTALLPLRHQLRELGWRVLVPVAAGVFGGTTGAILLLFLGDAVFASAVPYLIAFATLLFATAPTLRKKIAAGNSPGTEPSIPVTAILVLIFSIYGGYFGAGIGQILLATMILIGFEDLREANALKNLVGFVIGLFAVTIFVWSGTVNWTFALVMMGSSALGGYLGGTLSLIAPQQQLRRGIIAFGCFLTLYYFVFGA
ncbi:MAG: sulfite exporter TauE/SafE family protein [Boseongicola sp.]